MGAKWLVVLAACVPRPQPLLVCHNAHCTGDGPFEDDTLAALDASLALGDTVLDGVEIDFAWSDRCVFAHAPDPAAPDAMEPVARIAPYVASHGTASGEPFVLYIELKPGGDPPADALAACAVEAARAVPGAQVVVSSFSPDLTAAYARQAGPDARVAAELLPPTRTDLSRFTPLSAVSVDPLEIDRDAIDRYRDLGLDVALWGDLVTPELFDWITATEPRYVSVGDAPLVRAWMRD